MHRGQFLRWGATEVTDTSRLRVVHPLQLGGASQFDGRPSRYAEGVAVGRWESDGKVMGYILLNTTQYMCVYIYIIHLN